MRAILVGQALARLSSCSTAIREPESADEHERANHANVVVVELVGPARQVDGRAQGRGNEHPAERRRRRRRR